MRDYLWIIFMGMVAAFLYNYFANLLRAVGNSVVPLMFLAFSAVLKIDSFAYMPVQDFGNAFSALW